MNPLDLPLFLPVVLVVATAAVAGAVLFARATGAAKPLGVFVIIAIGVVVAATLTPQAAAFEGVRGSGSCDMSRLGPADLGGYLEAGETLGNVLLFLPLGIGLGLLPTSRTRAALLALALSLPFVVEGVQMVLPALDRACQGADIVDNLLGLGIGLAVGASTAWVMGRVRLRADGPPERSDGPAGERRAPS
jgi:hypothetical protein